MNWSFFENHESHVLVSDAESHELIYMNKAARVAYGIGGLAEIEGKKCYEVLQGRKVMCPDCRGREIAVGSFIERPYYNPVLRRTFYIRDTVTEQNGRLYRVEMAEEDEIYRRRMTDKNKYQNLEALAADGFRAAMTASTPDGAIETILEFLGNALHGERTYVFEKNKKGNDDNTYEWCAEGVTPFIDILQDLPALICANWYRNFSSNRNILITDIENIKESDPLQYENLKRQDIRSITVVPLYDGEDVIGFYGVDNLPPDYLDSASNVLQITAYFIVAQIRQRKLINQLWTMSCTDRLTGLGNRYAMDDFCAALDPNRSIGIIFCDITGLKTVNDTKGHEYGDRLILDAADCFRASVGEEGLFRTGGDELLALCPDITEAGLEEKVNILKKNLERRGVVMAVGAAWSSQCGDDLNSIIANAESLMYEDKAEYYRVTGTERRR